MPDDAKLPLKTSRFRVKDKASGKKLDAAARAVNTVWNHCNAAQRHALKHNQCWPNKATLQHSTAEAGKLIGSPAQTIQEVCDDSIDRRRGARKAKLRWPGTVSVGYPSKTKRLPSQGRSCGQTDAKFVFGNTGKIEGRIKSGSFPGTLADVGIAILRLNTNRNLTATL